MSASSSGSTVHGTLFGISAYGLWGLLPIFWKTLDSVPATEILAHRMAWSLVVVVGLLAAVRRGWPEGVRASVGRYALAGLLVSLNWGVYIWAVNHNFVVETALGYFINPLLSVLLGYAVLGERMRRGQVAAVVLAAVGVLWIAWSHGRVPWIALVLACTFALYGLVKKGAPLGALEGMGVETALLFPLAVAYLVVLEIQGSGAFGHPPAETSVLLAASGLATATPLIFFAAAARRLTLSQVGLLQYIAPTVQFLLGVFLYREPFDTSRLVGFIVIWVALALYSAEGVLRRRGMS